MSLERRRDTKEPKKEKSLETSSFRREDFTPLGNKALVQEEIALEEYEELDIVDELSEIELDVLDVAKEVLKLKRYDIDFEIEAERDKIQKYPIIEKLYAQSIGKLSYKKGYSKEDIFLAIRQLEEKNWIVTNERRTKLEILSNDKLVTVLEFIRKNPGIHARDDKIEKELDITRTPFLKHIMTLERFKLIRSTKIGKSLHYFAVDIPEDFDDLKAIFANPLIPQIIEEIFKNDSISISQIGENLDVYSGTIQYHIKKLMDLDLIKITKNMTTENKVYVVNFELLKKYNAIFKEPDFSKLLQGL
ncbi:MAG: winged helix-turn-helix transcriptional regulator [Candidatus Lokiarchaeota archaeon]|nr:winged helix-turn-helix transcriptional regulator [Candidatus Lokiarchaeota archaeon]